MKNTLLVSLMMLAFLACKPSNNGLSDFREVKLEDLNADNAPEGITFMDSTWQAGKGWEIVPSKDGKKAMLMQTGTDTGSAGFECKCNAGTGKCALRRDIIMCIADECTDCSTVLKIYNRRISINRTEW